MVALNKIASTISLVSNAPIIAFFAFLVLMIFPITAGAPVFLAVATVFGTVIPLATIFYLHKKGYINDFYSSDREKRWLPFLLVMPSYLIGFLVLSWLDAPQIATILMLCYLVNGIVAAAITLKWKISVHLIGLAGPLTILTANYGSFVWSFLLLAIPIGWARIRLKQHSISQVIAGLVLGVIITAIQLFVYLAYLNIT